MPPTCSTRSIASSRTRSPARAPAISPITDLSFEIVDDTTINITAVPAQPILPLLMSLVTIVPSETPMEFVRDPIGTGPYVMSEWTAGQQIVLDRRDDYWGEQPAVTKATYVFRSEPAVRAGMVASGEADIAPQNTAESADNKALDFAYPNPETVYLRIDSQDAPTNDIRVRKALNAAIDREAFIGTILPEVRNCRRNVPRRPRSAGTPT